MTTTLITAVLPLRAMCVTVTAMTVPQLSVRTVT